MHRELPGRPDRRARGGQQSRRPERRHAPHSLRTRALHRARRLHGEPAEEVLPPLAGREVRLRYAYFVTCRDVVKDASGEVVELRCTYDPATKGGNAPDGRKVKATMHWVVGHEKHPRRSPPLQSAVHAQRSRAATSGTTSIPIRSKCWTMRASSPRSPTRKPGKAIQFERQGYFTLDQAPGHNRAVFNRTVGLRELQVRGADGFLCVFCRRIDLGGHPGRIGRAGSAWAGEVGTAAMFCARCLPQNVPGFDRLHVGAQPVPSGFVAKF